VAGPKGGGERRGGGPTYGSPGRALRNGEKDKKRNCVGLDRDLELPRIDSQRDFENFCDMFYLEGMSSAEDIRETNNYNPGDDILIRDVSLVTPKSR
jgi:hypothetical protein